MKFALAGFTETDSTDADHYTLLGGDLSRKSRDRDHEFSLRAAFGNPLERLWRIF